MYLSFKMCQLSGEIEIDTLIINEIRRQFISMDHNAILSVEQEVYINIFGGYVKFSFNCIFAHAKNKTHTKSMSNF